MIEIENLLRWKPTRISEDHLTNFLYRLFCKWKEWHIVYSNPPGGSWKEIILRRRQTLYRQVGPKRGMGRKKRPDLAVQDLTSPKDTVSLFLVEDKLVRTSWRREFPDLLRAYFDGTEGDNGDSLAIRNTPFWHKKDLGASSWKTIDETDEDRYWFRETNVDYTYGFAYSLGHVPPGYNVTEHLNWMREQLNGLEDSPPPIVFLAVGWVGERFEPAVITRYSKTFPSPTRTRLERRLPGSDALVQSPLLAFLE